MEPMTSSSSGVVIIGGGLVGVATAYYLAKHGISSTVIERDAVGSHASGHAYGGLSALDGKDIHQPTLELSRLSLRLYRELASSLPDETGVNFEYRDRPAINLCFTDEEFDLAKRNVEMNDGKGYTVSLVESNDIRAIEPRISRDVRGAVYIEGTSDLEPQRLTTAIAKGAENHGARFEKGTVTGLTRKGSRVTGVKLIDRKIECDEVVVAMGPWSAAASDWLGFPVPIEPLKGQILRLRANGPPYKCSIGWSGNYAVTKPDGLVWAGTTEEDKGFDETPTREGRIHIMQNLVKMLPSMKDAELVRQTACLRPLSEDRMLILGAAPRWEGVYIATGGGRSGVILGAGMGQVTADLISTGATDMAINEFDPERFRY